MIEIIEGAGRMEDQETGAAGRRMIGIERDREATREVGESCLLPLHNLGAIASALAGSIIEQAVQTQDGMNEEAAATSN